MERPPRAKMQADIYQGADTVLLPPLSQTRKLGLGEAQSPAWGHIACVLESESKPSTSKARAVPVALPKRGLMRSWCFPSSPSAPDPTGGEAETDPCHGRRGGSHRVAN